MRAADGERTNLTLPFGHRADSFDAIRAELFGLLRQARERAGSAVPLTSLEREIAETSRLPTYVTTVTRVARLAPLLQQITVLGGLDGFTPRNADQFVYVMVPRAGRAAHVIAPGFRMEHLHGLAEDERPACAYYTVRRYDAEHDEMDLWFVLHDHGAGVSAWARTAQVGDRVALWGPRSSFAPPPDGPLLLVGDETALPAIAAILDQHAAKRPIQVVIETADPAQVIDLPSGPDVALCWVFRGGRSAGTSGRLLATIRDLQLHPDLAYAFGAGETREIGAIRRHLRRERGLAAERVRMVGYWKRTSATAG